MATDLEAHRILTNIEVPDGGYLRERIWSVRDRIMLRPEGDDTADLVGEIHERCDRAGVPEGKPGERVEWLAAELKLARNNADYWYGMCVKVREQVDRLETELSAVRTERDSARDETVQWRRSFDELGKRAAEMERTIEELRKHRDELIADLEAERAQLAGAPRNILDADKIRHAVNVIVAHVNQNSSSAEWIAAAILQENFA